MIPPLKRWTAGIALAASLLAVPPAAAAAPIASLEFVATALGGGLVQYEYTLQNLGDPVADDGFDVYDLTILFSPAISFDSGSAPMWDVIGGAGFVNTFSLLPGPAPAGTDVGPGQSLGGFRFVFTAPIGAASFSALFTNPDDPDNPVVFGGTSNAAATSPVPEPSSIVLLSAGAAALFARRRRRMPSI